MHMKIKQHARVALQSLLATFFVALIVVAVTQAATTIGNNVSTGTVTATGIVDITASTDTPLTVNGATSSTTLAVYNSSTGDLVNVFDGQTEVFTILDGGKVGVGSSTPDSLLSVAALAGSNAIVVGSTSVELFKINASGAASFNGGGWSTADFTVQGDAQANLLQVDASADRVGIASSTPYAVLSVEALAGQNAFIVGSSTAELFKINASGAVSFNGGGWSTADFTVGGDTNTGLFFIDASADRVGIGSSTPQALLSIGDPQANATSSIDVGLPCFKVKSYKGDGTVIDYYMWPDVDNTLGGWASSTTSCF